MKKHSVQTFNKLQVVLVLYGRTIFKKNPFKRYSNKLEMNSSPSCVHVASYFSSPSSREGK